MDQKFFEKPILNSPYAYPAKHWELQEDGQPTGVISLSRRRSAYYSPVPKPKKRKKDAEQASLTFEDEKSLSTPEQEYDPTSIINEIRSHVDEWRKLPNPRDWGVTPETARLLHHWRHHQFAGVRPFFCQVEAVETAIWLAEVAPHAKKDHKKILTHLKLANEQANPELFRIALKLATGAGKTTVMAMLIAWQAVNAKRYPGKKNFSRGFLIVAPGLTIKDRLRVLLPNDLESYYRTRDLVPPDMVGDIDHAKIVITNYHAFKQRERLEISKGTRLALEGWRGEKMDTLETEGQMIQRVMPELMGLKNVVVLNDEAHHCYRAKVKDAEGETEDDLSGDEKSEAKENNEAARMWISGLEAVKRILGVSAVYDLSATPFFLKGSGYREGTLFPWVVSDFSLMDAIECGIVKLPRVPVSDNSLQKEALTFRSLWEHIRKDMPKQGKLKGEGGADPGALPTLLCSAIDTLYAHYMKTFDKWREAKIGVPPVFIVVCNNTSTSDLVYKYISGYTKTGADGSEINIPGKCDLFNNFDHNNQRRAYPNTILIDSAQLESGEGLDKDFEKVAAAEIAQFRREKIERERNLQAADKITSDMLLREVMNTIGKKGKLGEQVRCVVSVSMLTEGWDVNTVTHILGVRAFGTQLLCEQVVGRGLRRQSYETNSEGLFDPEYADIFGIPFEFTAAPVIAEPAPPKETTKVHAVRPERDKLEIRFPRVQGYRTELPEDHLEVTFNENSELRLTPELTGPTLNRVEGIIGEGVEMRPEHLKEMRQATLVYHLVRHLLLSKYRDEDGEPRLALFGQMKRIVNKWLDEGYLKCSGDTYPAQLAYRQLADMAVNRIAAAITLSQMGAKPVKAVVDAYNPVGSSAHVNFATTKKGLWQTAPQLCHVNWAVYDKEWEAEFCATAEANANVLAYVKNHGLGFEVPYLFGSEVRRYLPDFIVKLDDGHGFDDPLNLVVEIKGYRGEDAKDKAETMKAYWVPGVNNLKTYGRWAFVELRDGYSIRDEFDKLFEELCLGKAEGGN